MPSGVTALMTKAGAHLLKTVGRIFDGSVVQKMQTRSLSSVPAAVSSIGFSRASNACFDNWCASSNR